MNMKPLLLAFSLCASGAVYAQNTGAIRLCEDGDEGHSGAIVAGVSVGNVRLGQTHAQVRAAMHGKPGASFSLARGFSSDLWKWTLSDSMEDCSLEALYRDGRVVQIEFISPEFKMKGVEDVNLTADWIDGLSQPTRTSTYAYNRARKGTSRQKYLDWVARGVALETHSHRAPDNTFSDDIHRIIVHPKNVRVVADFDGKLVSR